MESVSSKRGQKLTSFWARCKCSCIQITKLTVHFEDMYRWNTSLKYNEHTKLNFILGGMSSKRLFNYSP